MICDRAGWHTSEKLRLPHNLMLLHLPPKSPELNPAELLWREMRQKYLGNRVFPDVDLMREEICKAWLQLTENPQNIKSLGGFKWIADILN